MGTDKRKEQIRLAVQRHYKVNADKIKQVKRDKYHSVEATAKRVDERELYYDFSNSNAGVYKTRIAYAQALAQKPERTDEQIADDKHLAYQIRISQ